METKVHKATLEPVVSLMHRIRDIDEVECLKGSGQDVNTSLLEGFETSQESYVAFVDNDPFMIFGVREHDLLSNIGTIWMLSTDRINDFALTIRFLRNCKKYIDAFLNNYVSLQNYVYSKNTVSINWLKWLGFTVYEEEVNEFYFFRKKRDNICVM